MFGIMASVFRNATRTHPFEGTPFDREHHLRNRREEESRREREALDKLIRYRRGFW